jgi:Lon protease-like protein
LAILQDLLSPRQNVQDWAEVFASDVSDEILINTLSAMVDFTPLEKQLLLEADTIFQRARRLSDLLQFKRYERNDRKGRG